MKIDSIQIKNEGYVHCKSTFYTSQTLLSTSTNYSFCVGINKLIGEIDSDAWAISYLMSMYTSTPKSFVLFNPATAIVNNEIVPLEDLQRYTCYMDKTYPVFASKASIRRNVLIGIKKNHLECSPEDIRDIFQIDSERFEKPINGLGNEVFKGMAAIAYVNGKQIYCFPWFSTVRFEGFRNHMTDLLAILEKLHMIVVLPIGYPSKLH